MTPDWPNHLTPTERSELEEIDAWLASLNIERRAMMNRAKQRKHRKGLTVASE